LVNNTQEKLLNDIFLYIIEDVIGGIEKQTWELDNADEAFISQILLPSVNYNQTVY
jgi:hypothetical protein